MNLGFLSDKSGNAAAAQGMYEEVLRIARAFESTYSMGVSLNALGQLALRRGDLETASRYLHEALPLFEQMMSAEMTLWVRGNLALLAGLQAQRQDDQQAAVRAFEEALRLFGESNGAPATDQEPFVRQLLAELRGETAQPSA